ncbi:hypothetical protein [Pedobacter jeongneungensis]|uniref:hypothetical protein n=1 Tax=Pedobacter jeongneungensis TaxID=947309 RepID=UPI0004695FF8|nr:hypothetical protein [Pedobacter jeongneungensis]
MSCDSLKLALDPHNQHADCFSNSTAANENGKRFSIVKPDTVSVCKVKVDGCLINDQQRRKCDYFFEVASVPKQYFLVELKGVDLNTAITQLESTYDQLSAKITATPDQYAAIIVSSAVPAKANAKFRTAQLRLREKKRLKLDKRTSHYELTIKV